jgi:hypothetical protein
VREAQSVIDNAVISIFITGFKCIISANDAAKNLFGVENVSIGDLIETNITSKVTGIAGTPQRSWARSGSASTSSDGRTE